MAPMYDEDEDLWTGSGLSKQIAAERLAEKQAAEKAATNPSIGDRTVGGLKGAMSGASTGATLGTTIGGPGLGTLVGAGIGALAGGATGVAGAQKKEKNPSVSDLASAAKMGKGLYDEYEKIKPLTNDISDVKEAWELGGGMLS